MEKAFPGACRSATSAPAWVIGVYLTDLWLPFNPCNSPLNANFDRSLYNDCLTSSINDIFRHVYSVQPTSIRAARKPSATIKSFNCLRSETCARKSFPCHRSKIACLQVLCLPQIRKTGEWGRLRLTTLCTLRETSRGRRQVAGCGARCHNPASGKTTCSRSDLRVGNMSYGG